MAGRDIVTNLIANDKASRTLKDSARAAEDAAGSFDDLSAAEQRLALEAEKAAVRVERATQAAARAQERYGKESLQAREASLRLRAAQLDLAAAADKAGDQLDAAGDAAERAEHRFGGFRNGLGSLGAVMRRISGLNLALGLAPAVASLSAFGAVALTAGPPVVGLGVHIAALGAKVAQFGAAVAPAAASLLPLAAGLAVVKGTVQLAAPAILKALAPISAAFMGTAQTVGGKKTMVGGIQEEVGNLASRGLPALAREFVRVNFPAVRSNMLYIAEAINGVVLSVGKWINSAVGQRAIAASVGNVAEAVHQLAPDVSKLAIAFLNLFGRTAGDTRAIDGLATGLQRAMGGATRFLDSLTPAKIDAAWAAIGRFAGGVQGFVAQIPGWAGQVMGMVRWWRAHAEQIQHVRDVLAVVAVVVGVATGGWIPALVAGVSLLVAHWDQVSGALSRAKRWLGGTSDEAETTRGVIHGLKGAVGDLWSWFNGKLLPALERAGKAILPALRDAVHSVSDNLTKNKDVVGKVQGVLTALGIVLTEAVIPAMAWLFRTGLPLVTAQFNGMLTAVNKVVLPGIRIFAHLVLGQIGAVIHGAAALADAFGLPLAGRLKEAAGKFDRFRDQVNGALAGIKDQNVSVTAKIAYAPGVVNPGHGRALAKAQGGPVTGPGGPRDDRIPAWLSNGEYVVNAHATARHRGLLEAINSGRGYARGGLVMSTSTSGIPQMMAAERKALAAAAKRLAPDLGVLAGGGGSTAGARAIGKAMAAAFGWTGGQWNALERLWTGESGWNPRADNPTSTAFGIPQFLASTARAYGLSPGDTNPSHQIAAGLRYIRDAYGSPANAYTKWSRRSPHWYGNGGVINEPVMGVGLRSGDRYGFGEAGPETIVPGRYSTASMARAGSSTVTYETTINVNATGSDLELENKLVRVLTNANQRGRLRQIGLP